MNAGADDLGTMPIAKLLTYIRDRVSMNNYEEAARASRVLAERIYPSPHESALRGLFNVCLSMDAENPGDRCDGDAYRNAMVGAANALGIKVPENLLSAWERSK